MRTSKWGMSTKGTRLMDGAFGRRYYYIVYAIFCPENMKFKFGKTLDVEKRFASLRGMSPSKVELYGYIWMPDKTEPHIHQHLADERSHGEWFFDSPKTRLIAGQIRSGQHNNLAQELEMGDLFRWETYDRLGT